MLVMRKIQPRRQSRPHLRRDAVAWMNDGRHLFQSGDLLGPQSPFAGDQFVPGKSLANQQRLQDAVDTDGVGQFLQRGRVEGAARLLRVRLDLRDRDLQGEAAPRAVVAQLLDVLPRRNQGLEAPTQTTSFVHLAINSLVSSWY